MSAAFIGTLPGWITAGGMTGILGIVAWFLLGRGKLKVEDRKITTDDDADIRDHYADEVRQLRERLDAQSERHAAHIANVTAAKDSAETKFREALAIADRAHREAAEAHRVCELGRQDLLEKVGALKDQVAGLVRLLLQNSASGVLNLDPSLVSEVILGAAQRVDALFAKPTGQDADDNEE